MMKHYLSLVVLVVCTNSAIAEIGGSTESKCKSTGSGATKCSLSYDLSDNPRSQYELQMLDAETLKWKRIAEAPNAKGWFKIDAAALYRVMACDHVELKLNCISSSATWASSLKPLHEIPDSIEITDVDGSKIIVRFLEERDRYTVLSQYNVYLLSDIVNRATIAGVIDLPPMTPPTEGHDTAVRSMDHKVSHNTQDAYEGIRSQKKK